MKLNESIRHLHLCGNKHELVIGNGSDAAIIEIHQVKLLGFNLDRDLKFRKFMYLKYKKAGTKLNAIARLSKLLSFDKRRTLLSAFVMLQFSFAPLLLWQKHK